MPTAQTSTGRRIRRFTPLTLSPGPMPPWPHHMEQTEIIEWSRTRIGRGPEPYDGRLKPMRSGMPATRVS